MAAHPAKLTVVPYLQAWDETNRRLTVNVLVMPVDDPRQPLSDGWAGAPVPAAPAFQGADILLEPHFSNDPGRIPNRADVPGTGDDFALTMPADQGSIFDEFADRFDLSEPHIVVEQSAAATLRKYLPKSYRGAFAFVAPRTPLAVLDDSYHCALHCPGNAIPAGTAVSKSISWGDAFGMILRQPPVARAAGLVHTITLDVGDRFENGGWLFFSLFADSDFRPQFDADRTFVRVYATRVPALEAGTARPVFTPVLFPVAENAAATAALGSFDSVFGETQRFDDGFAKVVHARQPLKNDLADDDDETPDQPPVVDAGIQLAWDDEDVAEGLNRAVGLYPDGSAPAQAPSGAAGYRVDVRRQGDGDWTSLCRIAAPAFRVGDTDLDPFETELTVEVHPSKLDGQFWLPAYFTRWQGASLVAEPQDRGLLLGRYDAEAELYEPLDTGAVPLRYGARYDFRVRLADATGGGPAWTDSPVNAGEAPAAAWHFRRAVPPEPVGIEAIAPSVGAPPTAYRITRPGIGFPQAEFAGAVNAEARLAAIARANLDSGADAETATPISVPDPDADFVEITVMVQPPRFDPENDSKGWRPLYKTYRRFPPLTADGTGDPYDLTLDWTDCAQLDDVTWEVPGQPPGSVDGPVKVPTARDVRLVVRAAGRNDLTYWMTDAARHGQPTDLTPAPFHVPATGEPSLFAGNDPNTAIASVFLQPDPPREAPTLAAVLQKLASRVLPKRLASAVDLVEEDATLFGPPGDRMVFGCHGLKHHLPPDSSSLALTALGELPRQWLNMVRVSLDRDWTWRGLATPAFKIRRSIRLVPDGSTSTLSLGSVTLHHAVNRQAVRGTPDRSRTELAFVDAFVPPMKDGLPYELDVTYEITATLETGAEESFTVTNRLPVTTPPVQLPKVASVGHAFSPYTVGPEYAATGARTRMLWVEFAEAPTDGRDTYFARVLASAPDPMLLPATEPVGDPPGYEDPALDPEAVRVIRPGQADDFAGLSAMQRLIPAADDPTGRFYLIPLPPNMANTAKELFGFFTYEFRVGHDRGTPASPFWSTAQGRFGPPLTLEGVQHPAPTLDCSVMRAPDHIEATATFAQPVHDGRDLGPTVPNTEIWITLYGRVMQADGSTMRPIQLDARRAAYEPPQIKTAAAPVGKAGWKIPEIKDLLRAWGLPETTPLSALAVELLPEPNGKFADPLGGDLSQVRILRTSPLTEVEGDCCY